MKWVNRELFESGVIVQGNLAYVSGVRRYKQLIISGKRPKVTIGIGNIWDRSAWTVKDGNHRLIAYLELGFSRIPCQEFVEGHNFRSRVHKR